MAVLSGQPAVDQAALAKWEKGETAVRVEDLMLLAQVYDTTPDRLFFPPGDDKTPAALKRAHDLIVSRSPDAIERWLQMGDMLPPRISGK